MLLAFMLWALDVGWAEARGLKAQVKRLGPAQSIASRASIAPGVPAIGRLRGGSTEHEALLSLIALREGDEGRAERHLENALSGELTPVAVGFLEALAEEWAHRPGGARVLATTMRQLDDVGAALRVGLRVRKSSPQLATMLGKLALPRTKHRDERLLAEFLVQAPSKRLAALDVSELGRGQDERIASIFLAAELLGLGRLSEVSRRRLQQLDRPELLSASAELLELHGHAGLAEELLNRSAKVAGSARALDHALRLSCRRALAGETRRIYKAALSLVGDHEQAVALAELAQAESLDIRPALALAVRFADSQERVRGLARFARGSGDPSLEGLMTAANVDVPSVLRALGFGAPEEDEPEKRSQPAGWLRYFSVQVDSDFDMHTESVHFAFADAPVKRRLDFVNYYLGFQLEVPLLGLRYKVDLLDRPENTIKRSGGGDSRVFELNTVGAVRLQPVAERKLGLSPLWLFLSSFRYRDTVLLEADYEFRETYGAAFLVIGFKNQSETFVTEEDVQKIESFKAGFFMREILAGAMTDLAIPHMSIALEDGFHFMPIPYPMGLDLYGIRRRRSSESGELPDRDEGGLGVAWTPGLFLLATYKDGWLSGAGHLTAFYSWTWEFLEETHESEGWGGSFELRFGF